MASCGRFRKRIGPGLCGGALVLALGLSADLRSLRAQLAITEVMASALTITNGETVVAGPDFWELTNFGTNDIYLDGYIFRDNGASRQMKTPFANLTIHAGESILFFELDTNTSVTNEEQFCEWWWGTTNTSERPRIRMWQGFGFSSLLDEVWLFDASSNLVDMVSFDQSIRGRTFVYDPETGIFGMRSRPSDTNTFKAVWADDYGSPGKTTGPVPLFIIEQPESQEVDGCGDVSLRVLAGGLPRPHYQWQRINDQGGFTNIAGATESVLIIPDAGPADAGQYRVYLENGFTNLVSESAALRVNTNPLAPAVVPVPQDWTAAAAQCAGAVYCLKVYAAPVPPQAAVLEGQCAAFCVKARGFPCPNYQWQLNGFDLPGETGSCLQVCNASLDMSGSVYTVKVWNELGAAQASAALTVTVRPRLKIIEAMAFPIDSETTLHGDWFEVVNEDVVPVQLQGYRFRDVSSFASAFVIRHSLVIQPGESVIFVRNMSPQAFRRWWGAAYLPLDLQIVTFEGFGFNSAGEEIYFWNAAAKRDQDTVALATMPRSLGGISLQEEEVFSYCDATSGCTTLLNKLSRPGEDLTFFATEIGDLGSPGYTRRSPLPQFTHLNLSPFGLTLHWRAAAGGTCLLRYKEALNDPNWMELGSFPTTNEFMQFTDTAATGAGAGQRFYIVEESR